jgi:5-methylcytosine-specific restriction endonuclease McrA
MHTRIPTHLTDSQLLDALARCVRDERGATATVVAHLAETDARALHLGAGFSSLFEYCCAVLRLSESATYNRIEVARAARRYPLLLDRLADGSLNLTSARLLAPHLTGETHRDLIAAAAGLRKRAVEELLAWRFPRPDVAPLVRKLPARAEPVAPVVRQSDGKATAVPPTAAPTPVVPAAPSRPAPPPPPLATPLSADRYQIRFTASAATWEKLRVARDLLRHAVPSGDPAEIFDRALTALIAEHSKKKIAAVKKPARRRRATAAGSRHVPAEVRRAVWKRDGGQCAFVSPSGRRCPARGKLEFHHVEPYAVGGPPTVANIQLRCAVHNKYEAVLFYGPDVARPVGAVRERVAAFGALRLNLPRGKSGGTMA